MDQDDLYSQSAVIKCRNSTLAPDSGPGNFFSLYSEITYKSKRKSAVFVAE